MILPEIYSAQVVYKLAAAAIVTAWFALFAIAMGDDVGLFKNISTDMDRSVDAALADFGEAIKTSNDSQVASSPVLIGHAVAGHLILPEYFLAPNLPIVSLRRVRRQPAFLWKHSKVHELYQIFLI